MRPRRLRYTESVASGVKINQKFLKTEIREAVKTNVDAHMSGTLLLALPSAGTSEALAQYECDCFVRGNETCSIACLCQMAMKVCDVACNCHGFCCNSFATMPKLDVREGALGQELFTHYDLPRQKIAFVVCGQILSNVLYQDIAMIYPQRQYYAVKVSWPGHSKDVPGEPGEVEFVIDPMTHISGMANHSCDPNIAVGPCWSDGKVYAVGKTLRRTISKEALTFDYKWTGVENGPAAELCFCRSCRCRGFIADPASNFMAKSISHWEKELTRLSIFHDENEKFLLDDITNINSVDNKGLTINQQLCLFQRMDKNDNLQVRCENVKAALRKAKDAVVVARHDRFMEIHTRNAKKLANLSCLSIKFGGLPKIPYPSRDYSSDEPKASCLGWFAAKDQDETIQPLPLSLTMASGGSLRYVPGCKPPWIPSGSRSRRTSNLKHFSYSIPTSRTTAPRKVRPGQSALTPRLKPLRQRPEDVTHWPEGGLMSIDERKKLMSWIEGCISARDNSRSIYPPINAATFTFWLHMRVSKPDEKAMRWFRIHWSGLSTRDLIDRYEDEVGEVGVISARVVHCILADILTFTPFRWTDDVKLVEDKIDGDRWSLLWSDLLTLPGIVPDFSPDRLCMSHRLCCPQQP